MVDRVNLGAAIYCHDCFGNLSFIQKEIRKSKYVSRFFYIRYLHHIHMRCLWTFKGWGWSFLSVAYPAGVQLVFFVFSAFSVNYLAPGDLHHRAAYSLLNL